MIAPDCGQRLGICWTIIRIREALTAHQYLQLETNMIENLEQAFDAASDEYIKFERIENPLHRRPDICGFLKLDQLVPGKPRDMVCAAEHDEFFLDVDPEELAKVATQEDIVYLHRCGIRYDTGTDSLAMFA